MARPFVKNLAHLPVAPAAASGPIALENAGDAIAYPVWQLQGPGTDFRAISPAGEVLQWLGRLEEGESLTIDTQAGTVVDGTGANRYDELGEAPRMWTIPPGMTTATVAWDATLNGVSKVTVSWRARKWMVI